MPDLLTPARLLAQLKDQTGFVADAPGIGNLTIGAGDLSGRKVRVAIIENRIASGSFGVDESTRLAALFNELAAAPMPLLLFMDSAGARLSAGLPALGAFRRLYRAALAMAQSGAPFTALLGTHCYGGASLLAALAGRRVFSTAAHLAMSGPSILAQGAGGVAGDEMFRAIVTAAIGAVARVKLGDDNQSGWDGEPGAAATPWAWQHQQLGARLPPPAAWRIAEPVQRRDLGAIYPAGYQLAEQAGVVFGEALDAAGNVCLLGIVDRKPLGAARAWALADRVWQLASARPERLVLLVDCETHSTNLDDERLMLSSYLADLAMALAVLANRGTRIETTVLGQLGGGVYVLAAAASSSVNLLHGAVIHLLPSHAIASILGESAPSHHEIGEYRQAGVAERELKVGYLRERPN
jgi:hypothetical protein